MRMQLGEIDTDGNGVVDEGEWLAYIKAQSVGNAAAIKKLLRAFAKQCGAELDFDAMKRAEVTLLSYRLTGSLSYHHTISLSYHRTILLSYYLTILLSNPHP